MEREIMIKTEKGTEMENNGRLVVWSCIDSLKGIIDGNEGRKIRGKFLLFLSPLIKTMSLAIMLQGRGGGGE